MKISKVGSMNDNYLDYLSLLNKKTAIEIPNVGKAVDIAESAGPRIINNTGALTEAEKAERAAQVPKEPEVPREPEAAPRPVDVNVKVEVEAVASAVEGVSSRVSVISKTTEMTDELLAQITKDVTEASKPTILKSVKAHFAYVKKALSDLNIKGVTERLESIEAQLSNILETVADFSQKLKDVFAKIKELETQMIKREEAILQRVDAKVKEVSAKPGVDPQVKASLDAANKRIEELDKEVKAIKAKGSTPPPVQPGGTTPTGTPPKAPTDAGTPPGGAPPKSPKPNVSGAPADETKGMKPKAGTVTNPIKNWREDDLASLSKDEIRARYQTTDMTSEQRAALNDAIDRGNLREVKKIDEALTDIRVKKVAEKGVLRKILENAGKEAVASPVKTFWNVVKLGGVVALGIGVYYAYQKWFGSKGKDVPRNFEQIKAYMAAVAVLKEKTNDTLSAFRTLKFKPETNGEKQTQRVIVALEYINSNLDNILTIKDGRQPDFDSINDFSNSLGEYTEFFDKYIADKETIRLDLLSGDLDSADVKLADLNNYIKNDYAKAAMDVLSTVNIDEIERHNPQRPSGNITHDQPEGKSFVSIPVNVWGNQIDIGNKNEEWRNAFMQINQNILSHPAGKAFIDPEHVYGGGMDIGQTGDPSVDILQGVSELINNKVYTLPRLLRYMRKKHDMGARKKASGWKQAMQYYKGHPNVGAPEQQVAENPANDLIFSSANNKNEKKGKNLHNFSNKQSESIIITKQSMKKQSSYNSNEYFDAALQGVKDKYTRSYWTGLQSMHNESPEKRESDYKKLYMLHEETGTSLVSGAHPKSVELVEAMGKGGLVENTIEQQNHNIDVALSMPSGNYMGRHAALVESIIKFAKKSESDKSNEISDILKDLAVSLTKNKKRGE